MSVFVEIMKMLARTGMDKAHASTFNNMMSLFGSALSQPYTRLQGHGSSATSWLESHSHLAALVVPEVDLTAAMGAMGDCLGVAPQMERLVASSRTGAQVFGFAAELTQSEAFKGEVRAWLERVVASGYAREEIDKAAKACAHAAGSSDLAKCLTKKGRWSFNSVAWRPACRSTTRAANGTCAWPRRSNMRLSGAREDLRCCRTSAGRRPTRQQSLLNKSARCTAGCCLVLGKGARGGVL